jgi:hypothetical protein
MDLEDQRRGRDERYARRVELKKREAQRSGRKITRDETSGPR